MEAVKIPMLDRFDTTSHIMPYYAHTHKAFILLSSLCSVSRNKLDEYYDEFIYWMKENCLSIYKLCYKNNLTFPPDLFIFDFAIKSYEEFDVFLLLIKNSKECKVL